MALPAKYHKILQQRRQDIVSTIHPNTLLPLLLSKKLVTDEEFREISDDHGRIPEGQRNSKLLDIVAKKGANAFDLFVSALKEEDKHLGHESLAKTLEEEKEKVSKYPSPQPRGQRRQEEDNNVKFNVMFEDALNNRQGSNLELAVLTSMQASLQQLNTRVGTLETDLRAVKDTVKEIKHAEQITETKMSFSMQSIYDKLEHIQTEVSGAFSLSHRTQEDEEEFSQPHSIEEHLHRPMEESQAVLNENSYISAVSHYKQSKPVSLQQRNSGTTAEYAEPYEIFDFSTVKRAQSLDSLTASAASSKSSLLTVDSSGSSVQSSHYVNINSLVGSPKASRKQTLLSRQVFKYQNLEVNIAAFKTRQKIAEGKSGEFWEAINTADNAAVIIKYPKVQDKFKLKEISALTRISHPNVIKLIGISTIKSPIALITECVDNGNLLSFLRSNKSSLKVSQQFTIAESIARGMVQLERSNIVHCDLTAHSVLIDTHLVCKISSFSNAQCLDSACGSVTIPQHVELLLPLKWCAPEVFLDRKFSTKSDVWSYSVVLYEIFSLGAPPYLGMSNSEVRDFVTKGCVMPKPSSFSSKVYELMCNCFKFAPVDRPAFTHIYKTLKSFHDKKKGGPARENNIDDDYGTI